MGPLVLAELTAAVHIRAARLPRPGLGVFDQPIGILGRDVLDEIAAPDLEDAIDEVLEIARHGQARMALEDDPVEAVQRAHDEAGKLGHKPPYCRHGILPRLVESSTNHSVG